MIDFEKEHLEYIAKKLKKSYVGKKDCKISNEILRMVEINKITDSAIDKNIVEKFEVFLNDLIILLESNKIMKDDFKVTSLFWIMGYGKSYWPIKEFDIFMNFEPIVTVLYNIRIGTIKSPFYKTERPDEFKSWLSIFTNVCIEKEVSISPVDSVEQLYEAFINGADAIIVANEFCLSKTGSVVGT
jgi:hypothetical protein